MYNSQSHSSQPSDHPSGPLHTRKSSRSNSVSSSSVVTVKRSASLKDTVPDPTKPHRRATPPSSSRRSSVAHVAVDNVGGFREGIGNLNRWSQSTASSKSSQKEKGHSQQGNFSRRLSVTNNSSFSAFNGSAANQSSPPRICSAQSRHSPASSPNRRNRPRSPAFNPSSSITALPEIPSLPFLPATVYDPNSPTTSGANTPDTAGIFTPSTYTTNNTADYFNSQSRSGTSNSQRPPSRGKPEKSPLASPPISLTESESRYKSSNSTSGPSTSSRPSTAAGSNYQKPSQAANRERRTGSKDDDIEKRAKRQPDSAGRREEGNVNTSPRNRERREKDKKTMLSRALQKANTAVLLDNAQNFEGAMEAYTDACKLLQQVMIRSSGEEDRRKLDAIRVTYTNRIEELRRLDPGYQSASGKSLPARPMSNESLDETKSILLAVAGGDEEPAVIETATVTRIVNDRSVRSSPQPPPPPPPQPPQQPQSLPLRSGQSAGVRESVLSTAIRDVERTIPNSATFLLRPPPGRLGQAVPSMDRSGLESPMDRSYMPPPLSPRRPISPNFLVQRLPPEEPEISTSLLQPEPPSSSKHSRGNSNESISWLDTIDESGGSSCSSSVHSLSPGGLRRKHLRGGSGATEAEFDAALDAAVEAAYDDGLEPYEEEISPQSEKIAQRLRNVELAKEAVREAEREEAIAAAKYRYRDQLQKLRGETLPHVRESAEFNFQDEADEEERLLDEMTREYMLDGFDFDLQSKSALPRQSDSSGFSGSTFSTSTSSRRTTAGTSLSTVTEVVYPPRSSQKPPAHSPPPLPAPTGALPPITDTAKMAQNASAKPPSIALNQDFGVRSRRLSGQNAKTLKIETSVPPVPPPPHTEKPSPYREKDSVPEIPPIPKSAGAAVNGAHPFLEPGFKLPTLPASQYQPSSNLAAPSPQPVLPSPAETTFTVSPATPALTQVISNESTLVPSSPKHSKPPGAGIRKNKSSLSLKQRTLSMSSPDGSEASLGTPLSTTFSFTNRKPSNGAQTAPTPSVPTFNVNDLPTGGMHLFESDIHSPYSPGSPNALAANAPIPLEPCPDSYLLRPFWLMRCFYQTIAHPRGGYLSTKLFVPRDVWRVKGVKLKNVDDKIANCDYLTAALQKLGGVDTFDADAVLDEMQALEVELDRVQTQLVKKLGNEVGVNGISSLFKEAHNVGNGTSNGDGSNEKGSHGSQDHAPKSAVAQSKSYLTSWRKLRSKNSAVGLSSMGGAKPSSTEVSKDTLTMATLPMTSLPNIRFAKRDVAGVVYEGPNASYMESLARLFDAVQILDQITRQVEDPGLKHSSPTHVGLELSARHAAEFFGFYICRFVLTDLTMMLDKFIKRGSEWVLV